MNVNLLKMTQAISKTQPKRQYNPKTFNKTFPFGTLLLILYIRLHSNHVLISVSDFHQKHYCVWLLNCENGNNCLNLQFLTKL